MCTQEFSRILSDEMTQDAPMNGGSPPGDTEQTHRDTHGAGSLWLPTKQHGCPKTGWVRRRPRPLTLSPNPPMFKGADAGRLLSDREGDPEGTDSSSGLAQSQYCVQLCSKHLHSPNLKLGAYTPLSAPSPRARHRYRPGAPQTTTGSELNGLPVLTSYGHCTKTLRTGKKGP